jgi:hypothetical protein
VTPTRVQLRRTKGWRMPPNTVKVDRTTRWGNHYRPGGPVWRTKGIGKVRDAAEAVDLFRRLQAPHMTDIAQLRGKNLACWCRPGEPCHADVLLELANRPIAGVPDAD